MPPKPITLPGSREATIRSATLIRVPMIRNAAAMAYALKMTHEYFAHPEAVALGWTPPPLPSDPFKFAPCALLITDAHDIATGENIGRIRFLQDVDGYDEEMTHFDQTWVLSPADR